MPYVSQEIKARFAIITDTLRDDPVITEGEINYLCTEVVKSFLDRLMPCHYEDYNAVIGALESCKLEFYRRMVASYEDRKIIDNGDVYKCK